MHILIIFFAKYLFVIIALVAAITGLLLPRQRRLRFFISAAVAVIVATIFTKLAGAVYFDPRPFITHHFTPLIPHGADNGFPSDHTVLSFTAALLIWPFRKKVSLALIILATIVGLARVLAGVHTYIDVLGGVGVAGISVTIAHYLGDFIDTKYLYQRQEKFENRPLK